MFFSILTYSDLDQEKGKIAVTPLESFNVFLGNGDGDATVQNGLGPLGAIVAYVMVDKTVGYWSLAFAALIVLWAIDIFKYQRLTPRTKRYSLATLLTAVSVAALTASINDVVDSTPTAAQIIPLKFYGDVGAFIAGATISLIKPLGSLFIWLVITTGTVILGFELDVQEIAQRFEPLRDRLLAYRPTIRRRDKSHPEMDEEFDDAEDVSDEDEDGDGDDYVFDDEPENEPPAVSTPRKRGSTIFGSQKRAIIRPGEFDDEEPAVQLRRASQDQAGSPQLAGQLSNSVRILRPSKLDSEATDPGPATEPDEPTSSIDISEVQRRLQQLHPKKDITIRQDLDEEDDVDNEVDEDVEEIEEEFEADEDTEDVDDTEHTPAPVSNVKVNKPLTVTVQDTLFPVEPEIQLSNATLYDEEIAYKPPPSKLLVEVKDEGVIADHELQANANKLQEKLETFKVRIENLTVTPGPVVTQYEFVPASGIKVSQIENLADDIALALKAQGVRIIAPIPGKGTVGIEIPNQHPSIVRFSSIIKSPKYHAQEIKLPLAMGKTVVGEVFCADLTKMPHLLIAGATGKGKSVGINTIIASLLYRIHPKDLKFVIVDPKRVEMNLYASLRDHYLAISPDINESIITSPQNAVVVLKALVEEMQQRFSILAAAGQRNITDYNQKVKDGKIKDKGGIIHRPMPYIVVIIDELADLMMTASKEVEEPICRLAQLARAVGIHCIVATQRPSVDVVTGLIKANFPARIAYQVSSRIDSRTILDGTGAEHLIGNGDMLFAPGNTPLPIRMQNAFISTEEVEALCEWIGNQKGYSTPYMLPSINKRSGSGGGGSDDRDVLFEEAARIFVQLQQASTSTLQRRLKVGYARAARIVDELEMAGIVGPPDGSRGRPVLLQSESELEAYL